MVGRDAHGGVARLHRGGLLQHDGHADQLSIAALRRLILLDRTVGQLCRDGQVDLFPDKAGGMDRRDKPQHHAEDQHPGKELLQGMFHMRLSFY